MTSPATKYLTVRQAAFIGVGAMVGAGIFALLLDAMPLRHRYAGTGGGGVRCFRWDR